jgi:VCBS repeat-containing protein
VDEDATTANLVPLLLSNDSDPDAGDTFSIAAVDTTGTVGTVAFSATSQTLTYSADAASQDALAAGETATDSFGYTIVDSHGAASAAAVTVTVTGVNDAPVAAADNVAVNEDATTSNLVLQLLANDIDVDHGDQRRIIAVATSGTAGSVSFDAATQTLNYAADAPAQDALAAGQIATDSFAYTVSDLSGATSSATVTVTVTGVDDAPVVANPVPDQSAQSGAAFSLTVAANTFSDVDAGDVLAYSGIWISASRRPTREACPLRTISW